MNYPGYPHPSSCATHPQLYPYPTPPVNHPHSGQHLFPPGYPGISPRRPPPFTEHGFYQDQFSPEHTLARMNSSVISQQEDAQMQRIVHAQARARERTRSSGSRSLASQSPGYDGQSAGSYVRARTTSSSALPVYPQSRQYHPEFHPDYEASETATEARLRKFKFPSRHGLIKDSLSLPYMKSLPRSAESAALSSTSSRKETPTPLQLTNSKKSLARSAHTIPVNGYTPSVSSGRSSDTYYSGSTRDSSHDYAYPSTITSSSSVSSYPYPTGSSARNSPKQLAPLPRYDPYMRPRADSMSSVVEGPVIDHDSDDDMTPSAPHTHMRRHATADKITNVDKSARRFGRA